MVSRKRLILLVFLFVIIVFLVALSTKDQIYYRTLTKQREAVVTSGGATSSRADNTLSNSKQTPVKESLSNPDEQDEDDVPASMDQQQETHVQELHTTVKAAIDLREASEGDVTQESSAAVTSPREKDNATPELHHVVFLKVHKAGSSTVQNIFLRFGLSHDLKVMVPITNNCFSQSHTLRPGQFLHYSPDDVYDILCCHVNYDRSAMAPYFPPDTKYIGIVRHPFSQFVSAFWYYRVKYKVGYLVSVPGDNPISTFLQEPSKYEPRSVGGTFTNNRMSYDLGYPPAKFHNTSYMYAYVEQLVKELDFVMVVEYFDESLLMMKRMLGWNLKDIIYISVNTGPKSNFNFTEEDKNRHKTFAKLDYILYDRFLGLFLERLAGEGPGFSEELENFKIVKEKVTTFCTNIGASDFVVTPTHWNEAFNVTSKDCDYMMMGEVNFVDVVRKSYHYPEPKP